MNKTTQINRLQKLADFLRELPKQRFNYSQWVGDDWAGKQDLSCGTATCALGWAATIPEFRRLGLRLFKPEDNCGMGYVGLESSRGQSRWAAPEEASREIFGLDLLAHEALFAGMGHDEAGIKELEVDAEGNDPMETTTPKEVAKRIEKYIEYLRKQE